MAVSNTLAAERLVARDTGQGRRTTLAIAAAGTFLALAAYTLPLSDFAGLSVALGAGPATQTWILSSMSLGLTAGLLLSGTLADRHGRRSVFLVGAGVLVLGTLLAVLADLLTGPLRPDMFVAGRIIEGVGASAVIASALALISEAFVRPRDRALASSVWGASLGAGIAIGPVGAAVADRAGHWWLSYAGLGVLTVLLITAAAAGLAESRSARRDRPDLIGTALFLAGTVLLLIGLVRVRTASSALLPVILFASAGLLLVIFVISQLRLAEPMLDLRLFRQPRFAAVHLSGLIVGFGSIGLASLVGTYAVIVLGLGVWPTTGLIAVWAGASTVTAVAARWLPARAHGGRQLGWGLLVIAVGQLIMINAATVPPMLAGLLVSGIAAGVVNSGLGRETAASAPEGRSGLGSGVNNTARYLGSAIGVTVSATLLLHGGHDLRLLHSGWNAAVVVCSVALAVGAVAVLLLGSRAEH
ncbi:MAG: MFS transporter [Microlunatus sp.]|nr:MFS transporter [Microlunatus sp.]